jgi:hypothetical protein
MFNSHSPTTCETPRLSRRGVSCAISQTVSTLAREFHLRAEMGGKRGHNTVTDALSGRYSNQPPDKVVKAS